MNGARLIAGMDGLSGATLLCRITFISFVVQSLMERVYLNLPAFGKPTRAARSMRLAWQREFFDHILRSEKWNYLRANPVRAGLVSAAEEWKYAGETETLML
jgi:hypothetical protein